jgi:hypothetical protein
VTRWIPTQNNMSAQEIGVDLPSTSAISREIDGLDNACEPLFKDQFFCHDWQRLGRTGSARTARLA